MASETIRLDRRRRPTSRLFGGREGAQKRFVTAVITPSVVFMAVFMVLPIVWAFALSFFDFSPRRTGTPFLGLGADNPFVGLEQYRAMTDFSSDATLNVRQFHTAVNVTLLFAFLVVPLNLLITLPLAAMIESVHERARPVYRTVFFLPVLASSVGVAIMWGFLLHPQNGLLNGIISRITGKVTAIAWITDPDLVYLGIPVALLMVIVAYLWQDIGYNMVIFIAALQAIPRSVTDAARVDGASAWQVFRHITLPLLKPTILLASILTMISAFQVFDLFQVMTDGGPEDQTLALSVNIYRSAFRYQQMGWAAAMSVVLFLIVFVISMAQARLLRTKWEY
jgi:multiple sugar transport system permease protein/raffinose/stachyose/melibiose transport system permease protein